MIIPKECEINVDIAEARITKFECSACGTISIDALGNSMLLRGKKGAYCKDCGENLDMDGLQERQYIFVIDRLKYMIKTFKKQLATLE